MGKRAILFSLLLSPLLLAFAFFAYAHAGEEHSVSYNLAAAALTQDESVDPATLGVGTTDVLPGHPFYFFKSASRGFRTTLAFSAEKKANLKLKFASEKIVESQLLLERGDKDRAADNLKSYEKDLAAAKSNADKEKFIKQTLSHQAVLDKIEKEVGEEKVAVVKEVREKAIEHAAEAVANIADAEVAKNILIAATSDEGSAFKPLRNLEVLKAIEEKVPEQAKEAVKAAQENSVKRFKSDYDKATDEEKAALTDYIKSAGGDASRYIEVVNENKEILGDELSQVVISASEEKKTAHEAIKSPVSSSISAAGIPTTGPECIPPVSPKPNVEAQDALGTMTITPEISEEQYGKDTVLTISLTSRVDSINISIAEDQHYSPLRGSLGFDKEYVIDYGPKLTELPQGGKAMFMTQGGGHIAWHTRDYNTTTSKTPPAVRRPRLPAGEYWVKVRAGRTTSPRADENVGSYGWKEVSYGINYVTGDSSRSSDFKNALGRALYYIGGPQHPMGQIVRVGEHIDNNPNDQLVHYYGKPVTVKAGEPFEIEATPRGWQGGTMMIDPKERSTDIGFSGTIVGPQSITVKAGESAVWKIRPKGTYPVKGRIGIKNACNDLDLLKQYQIDPFTSMTVGSFEAPIKFDFKGVTKEKMQLTFQGAIAYVLDFKNPQSSLPVVPRLSLMSDGIVVAPAPDFTVLLQAVYKDNPQEIVKSILITPEGKGAQAGSAQGTTDKEGTTRFKIRASNVTREELSRGILLKESVPDIPGLTSQLDLLFTNVPEPKPAVSVKELSIIPDKKLENLKEGDMVIFTAKLTMSDGSTQVATSKVKWTVAGQIGSIDSNGLFLAQLDPVVAAYGEGSGEVVATYKDASGKEFVTQTSTFKVGAKKEEPKPYEGSPPLMY